MSRRISIQLSSFGERINAAVIGASGGIGCALADELEGCLAVSTVFRLTRPRLDLENEETIAASASAIKDAVDALHLIIVATGILHADGLKPEKSWRALSAPAMETAFRLNTIGPALVAKHFLPLLANNRKSAFAALSARVGSIKDNNLGGWHAYRASKAALNMMIKTLSIELARRNPNALCVGLHPGTVDTPLSKPFQGGVPNDKLFTPTRSARYLLSVLDRLSSGDTGQVYAWDGSRIPA